MFQKPSQVNQAKKIKKKPHQSLSHSPVDQHGSIVLCDERKFSVNTPEAEQEDPPLWHVCLLSQGLHLMGNIQEDLPESQEGFPAAHRSVGFGLEGDDLALPASSLGG